MNLPPTDHTADTMNKANKYLVLAYAFLHHGRGRAFFENMHFQFGPSYNQTTEGLARRNLVVLKDDDLYITEQGLNRLDDAGNAADDIKHQSVFEYDCEAYELELVVNFQTTAVWRHIKVPKRINFEELHAIIQATFNWTNVHPYDFTYVDENQATHRLTLPEGARRARYYQDEQARARWRNRDGSADDLRRFRLEDVLPTARRLIYNYNYNNDWHLDIRLACDVTLPEGYVNCSGGEGDAPLEDIGSEESYLQFLDIISSTKHPCHKKRLAWDKERDFEHFDLESVNRRLAEWRKYDFNLEAYDVNDFVRDLRDCRYFFEDTLLARDLSQQAINTHAYNVWYFLNGCRLSGQCTSISDALSLVVEYLGFDLLDPDGDLPTVEEYQGIIESLKLFFETMSYKKYVEEADYVEMLKLIREHQAVWVDTLMHELG